MQNLIIFSALNLQENVPNEKNKTCSFSVEIGAELSVVINFARNAKLTRANYERVTTRENIASKIKKERIDDDVRSLFKTCVYKM